MDKISRFLDNVCIHIGCKEVHKDIREELQSHMEELTEENIDKGMTREEAIDSAVNEMGDAFEIGTALNIQHKPHTEWSLIILTGIIMLMAAAFYPSVLGIVKLCSGILLLFAAMYFDYRLIVKHAFVVYAIIMGILLMGILVGGRINGSIRLGIINVSALYQLIILPLAAIAYKFRDKGIKHILLLFAMVLLSGITVFFSTASFFLVFVSFAVFMTWAVMGNTFDISKKIYVLMLSVFVIAVCTLIVLFSSRTADILRVLVTKGQSDPYGAGWQMIQVGNVLKNSSMLGGSSALPFPDNSGMLALVSITASYGRIAGVVVVCMLALFVIRLFTATLCIKEGAGSYIACFSSVFLLLRAAIGILINFNILPPLGINIPVISYGLWDNCTTMLLIGFVLSVYRRKDINVTYED